METLLIVFILFNVGILISLFNKSNKLNKCNVKRLEESKRYFNGSIVKKDSRTYKAGCYTEGLSAQKNGNSILFSKQEKMCDTSLLY